MPHLLLLLALQQSGLQASGGVDPALERVRASVDGSGQAEPQRTSADDLRGGSAAAGLVPEWIADACLLGDEAVVSDWLHRGGEVSATFEQGGVRGITLLMAAAEKGHERVVELLLQRGAEVGPQNSDGATALLYAIGNGHEQPADLLIRHGAEINQQNSKGGTALMYASKSTNPWALQMVEYLVSKGADINQPNYHGDTALMLAASVGEERVVELLLDHGAAVDMQDARGNSALMYASSVGRVPVIHALLRAGAQAELQNGKGLTALRFAEDRGCAACAQALKDASGSEATKDELPLVPDAIRDAASVGDEIAVHSWLDGGGNANSTFNAEDASVWGITLLMAAAEKGHSGVVDLLLQRGANVNQQNSKGQAALRQAALGGHQPVVEALLQRGAKVNQQNNQGSNALTEAAYGGHERVVDLLLNRGAVINHQKLNGFTALMLAAHNGQTQVVELLLQRGANVHQQNTHGGTALMYAAMSTSRRMLIETLLQHGADVNQQDNNGETSLMVAAHYNHPATVRLLLRAGARVEVRDRHGRTALHFAEAQGHTACAGALKGAQTVDAVYTPLDGWWGYGIGLGILCIGLGIKVHANLREQARVAKQAEPKHSGRSAEARRAAKVEARRAAKAAAREAAEAAKRQAADTAKREAAAREAAEAAAEAERVAAAAREAAAEEAAAAREAAASEAAREEAEAAREAEAAEAARVAAAAAAAAAPVLLKYEELDTATASFSAARVIGVGGNATVYKADPLSPLQRRLPGSSRAVAVKRLTVSGGVAAAEAAEELRHEVDILCRLSHPNVLSLLGYCLDRRGPSLVYPIAAGGNLEDRLLLTAQGRQRLGKLGCASPPPMPWVARCRVLCEV